MSIRQLLSIVSPSGAVVESELLKGLARLQAAGWQSKLPSPIDDRHFVFAGTDQHRAKQMWDAAWDPTTDVVWTSRGGYGAARILPELERLTLSQGTPPPKLLCGFSDITALHEFVMSRWGWSSLHCDVPCASNFAIMAEDEWNATLAMVRGERTAKPAWQDTTLLSLGTEVLNDLEGRLVGGNLTVLTSLVGTPFAADHAGGRLLFLEDISEAPYRLDRYLNQLWQAGALRGVRAIILGTFEDCEDSPGTTTLANGEKVLSRPQMPASEWMRYVFGEFSRATRIPVVATLPVGHGPERAPLPLGAKYRLTGSGKLQLLDWDWWKRA